MPAVSLLLFFLYADLGWDWGPAYAASGIHGDIELLGFSNAVLGGEWWLSAVSFTAACHMKQCQQGNMYSIYMQILQC
jgi:hypothetical protein